MAQMYAAVEKGYPAGFDPKKRDHEISVTLARVLFLLFGDDTEMWTDAPEEPLPDLFQDFVKDHTERDGSDIAAAPQRPLRCSQQGLDRPQGPRRELVAFPYVNGGIFEEHDRAPRTGQRLSQRHPRCQRGRLVDHQPGHLRLDVPVRA